MARNTRLFLNSLKDKAQKINEMTIKLLVLVQMFTPKMALAADGEGAVESGIETLRN